VDERGAARRHDPEGAPDRQGKADDQGAGEAREFGVAPRRSAARRAEEAVRRTAERRTPEYHAPPLDPSLFRAAADRWEGALDSTLRSSVIPYGYTVTIWAAGAYLINLQGTPNLAQAFMFVSGAILAFACLAALSHRLPPGKPIVSSQFRPDPSHPIFAAGLHIAAVGLALGAATTVEALTGGIAWLLAPFAATTIYLGAASAELAIAIELQRREFRLQRPRPFANRSNGGNGSGKQTGKPAKPAAPERSRTGRAGSELVGGR
jgi:hypothetical protein